MRVSYNYSKVRNRDKKLYSISGTKISSTGISYQYLKVLGVVMLLFNVIGAVICFVGGRFYYWPFNEHNEPAPGFLIAFVGLPFAVASALLHLRIQNHTLLDVLASYLRPRRVRDEQGRVVTYGKYEQDGFVHRIL